MVLTGAGAALGIRRDGSRRASRIKGGSKNTSREQDHEKECQVRDAGGHGSARYEDKKEAGVTSAGPGKDNTADRHAHDTERRRIKQDRLYKGRVRDPSFRLTRYWRVIHKILFIIR